MSDVDPLTETQEADGEDAGLSERVLNQEEIDSLLGFDLGDDDGSDRSGIRAIINSRLTTSRCRWTTSARSASATI